MTDTPKIWIGTSWKMNKTLAQARSFAEGLKSAALDPRFQPFVIPPFTALQEVRKLLADNDVLVGAQNMHWADQGAWTGEISPLMLADLELDIVELGHSERRAHFGETDETVGLKVEAAVRHGLIPLVCVGETGEEKNAGRAEEVLDMQVRAALGKLSDQQKQRPVVLAYEPVWAIGDGGTPASPEYADERQARIIALSEEITGRRLPCLYGGSVNPQNCAELIVCPHIHGLFIGRSAWNVDGYLDIIQRCSNVI